VPYLVILQRLIQTVAGSVSALLLDPQGEVVVEAGQRDEQSRLIGAYQGIGLATVRRSAERYEVGTIRHVLYRYGGGSVILRPLKDGYYLVFSLSAAASVPAGVHHSARAQESLNAEI
jgi:predicted regulator of Ras-like GTPase activity (Roadblock/LC7/MglB family)